MESNNEKRTLRSPVIFDSVDPRIATLNKSAEEKTYVVLYYGTNDYGDEEKSFDIYTGREECYKSIRLRIITDSSIDIHRSKVLVDVAGINSKGNPEWFLKGIDNALSIYQFCKTASRYFANDDFNIDDYNESSLEDEETSTDFNIQKYKQQPNGDPFNGDKELADAYIEAMKEK